jgi:dihydrofolate synthase / folylpolyglutamate synthase
MNYQECLDFLYSQLPMYQRDGSSAFKKDLTNTLALCRYLQDPQKKFRSVHVAGTNGKGSVCHLIAAILQSEGYRVGIYTSPHYFDFRERIKINGQPISKKGVLGFMQRVMPKLPEIEPSFFELTVAMAFDYFARQHVDFAIIETGLGGRLDSTNVVMPLISVITNISLDHQSMLGDTLPEIAGEKAGIMKPFVPVVIGEKDRQTDPVFKRYARNRQAPLYFAGDLVHLKNVRFGEDCFTADLDAAGFLTGTRLRVGLAGQYQTRNLITALAAVRLLCEHAGVCVSRQALLTGLSEVVSLTSIQGRWQKLREQHPRVVADSGHNYAGLSLAMQQLQQLKAKRMRIVFGVSRDKDYRDMLTLLPREAVYYWCAAALPRSLPPDTLAGEGQQLHLAGKTFSSVGEAVRTAIADSGEEDVVFIGGSSFVVGEALTLSL